jgi:hypothetical protein
MKLGSTQDVCPGSLWMVGATKDLLYVGVCTAFSYRRSADDSAHSHDPARLHRRVGHVTATRSHPGGVPGDQVHGMARSPAHAGHHDAARPGADAAWQYRLQPSTPSVGLAVYGGGLLSSTRETPTPFFRPPPRAYRQCWTTIRPGRRAVVGASDLLRRWLRGLQTRYACPPGGVRPADGATAGMRFPRRAPARALSRGHRSPLGVERISFADALRWLGAPSPGIP